MGKQQLKGLCCNVRQVGLLPPQDEWRRLFYQKLCSMQFSISLITWWGNTEGVVGNNKMLQLWRDCFKRCELMRSRYKECLRCMCIATTYKTLQPSRLWILRYLGPRSSNYIYSPGFHQMWFDYQSWLCVKSRADYTSRCDLIECSDEFLIVVAPD